MSLFTPTITRSLPLALVTVAMVAGCYSPEDYGGEGGGEGEGTPVSAVQVGELVVGGHQCPTRGEIAVRTIPSDNMYYVTTFGGGRDNQRMACGTFADARWLYMAGSWRFGCGARVRVTNPNSGRWCVTEVADVGPNICVERAARKAIVDVSPVVTRELFNRTGVGWSDRVLVRAEMVPRSTQLGCGNGTPPQAPAPTPTPGGNTSGGTSCFSGTYGRSMALATCLQSRFDNLWYQCTSIGWLQGGSIASTRRGAAGSCSAYLPLR